ncbi:MAG TPA: amidohydrolase, partial [candidate division Zixibacteria bacterium]|nr:amidohydrolase [candidate division Zixibacteria bacterium]
GITAETPDPDGGRIIRDSAGAPTGVFIDNATALITAHIPDTSLAKRVARYKAALAECNRLGLTGLHDAHIDSLDIAAYNTLADSGQLTLRVYGMLDSFSGSLVQRYFQSGPSVEAGGLLTIRSVKGYGDGALGSRGAALLESYTDEPGNTGLMVTHPDSLLKLAQLCVTHGFQFCIHAIGDRGVRESLNAFATALGADSVGDHRFRVEHAQVIALEDIPRFARLGVIPAVQPTHCTSDMYWAEQRLGPQRIHGAYAWRSLLDAGCRLPLGSDFPVENVNPLWGIYAAVTRQDHSGWPESGWYPGQRLTVEEAVRGFTSEAAYAAFDEANTGTLEVGKQADITLLKTDIFSTPAAMIRDTETLATILAGHVVFRAQ